MISESERAVFERSELPVALCSLRDGNIHAEVVSDGFCASFNLDRDAMFAALRSGMRAHTHPDDAAWVHNANAAFLRGETKTLNVVFRNRAAGAGAEYRLVLCCGCWQTMADGSRYALMAYLDLENAETGIARLYTAFGESQANLIYKDPVTELPNLNYLRQFADGRINHFWIHDKQPVLIYFDVKNLHGYNLANGYTNGDRLMKLIARTLQEYYPDGTVARGADDGFIVFTEFTSEEELGARICAVNDHIIKHAYARTSGVRAGVAIIEPKHKSVNAFDCARAALREIGDDLNTVYRFYSADRDELYWKRRYLFENFERAMAEGWIRVYYQAIVRTKTRKMTMLEALARWDDPQRGLIPPGEFIPLLSHYHLLYKLDLYMVEQICREFSIREAAGLPMIPVSVNLSAQDFDHADMPGELERITDKYAIRRDRLIVEITEQDIAQGTEHFKRQLQAIRALGFRLWIDDFGSGYSSLNVFSQFDIDRIKFDTDLLRHLDDKNGANRRILRAFTNVCRELGVHTLCEGVETQEQWDFLKEIDCEMAQGFLFFRPLPGEAAVERVRRAGQTLNYETRAEEENTAIRWLLKETDGDGK